MAWWVGWLVGWLVSGDLRRPAGTTGQDSRSTHGLQNKQHDRASWYRVSSPRTRAFWHEDSYPFWSSAEVIQDSCINTCRLPNIFMGRFVIRAPRILHILIFSTFYSTVLSWCSSRLTTKFSLGYRVNCTASAVTQRTWYHVGRKKGIIKKKILDVFKINLVSYSASIMC